MTDQSTILRQSPVLCCECSQPTGEFVEQGESQPYSPRCEVCEKGQVAANLLRWTRDENNRFTRSRNDPAIRDGETPPAAHRPGECQNCGCQSFTASYTRTVIQRVTLGAITDTEEYDEDEDTDEYFQPRDTIIIDVHSAETEIEDDDPCYDEISDSIGSMRVFCDSCGLEHRGERR